MNLNSRHGLEDAALVHRCLGGDASAWSELVMRHQRIVYAMVTRMGMDEHAAADVFQTVFVRLMAHLPRLQQPERLQAWIVTTAKRETLRMRYLALRSISLSDDSDTGAAALEESLRDESPLADAELEALQDLALLRSALDRLDPRCQTLLHRLFAEEASAYGTVAQEMGVPVGSVGPTRARCLAKLRRLFDAEAG